MLPAPFGVADPEDGGATSGGGAGTPYAGAVIIPVSIGAGPASTITGGPPYAGAGTLSFVVFPQPAIAVALANKIAARDSGRAGDTSTAIGIEAAAAPQNGHAISDVRI